MDPRYTTIAPTSALSIELRCEECKKIILEWQFEEFKDDRLSVFTIVRESLRHGCQE